MTHTLAYAPSPQGSELSLPPVELEGGGAGGGTWKGRGEGEYAINQPIHEQLCTFVQRQPQP